jgi:hypothetical protein
VVESCGNFGKEKIKNPQGSSNTQNFAIFVKPTILLRVCKTNLSVLPGAEIVE